REEDHVRVLVLDPADHPLPEPDRLGVRVVDAEGAHPARDPDVEHVPDLRPDRAGIVAVEVERVHVLVFLGRVLRVLDGSVWPMGWIGGRYTTSKPIAAARSSCASASRKVAPRRSSFPERGKNSYQAAKRARSRSENTSSS